ncbi:MAG: SGNH/GDSL hydrolase family protein [Erythrobacter sp.]
MAIVGLAATATAQTTVPGDPYAADPVGIVADPCPQHAEPADAAGWQIWRIHLLTRDFGQLCHYATANREIEKKPVRVVFLGDSITEGWKDADPDLFTNGLVDRGISGQTTSQMLVRFRQDVIALKPLAVHIMAGTNDVAGNTGALTMATIEGNIQSMAELARANGIKVLIASIPPASAFPWNAAVEPAPRIAMLNGWLEAYARRNNFTYVDYHAALARSDGAMKPELASDGVHPTRAGYALMRPITLSAIRLALREP